VREDALAAGPLLPDGVGRTGGRRAQGDLTKGEEMSMRSTSRRAAALIAGAAITSILLADVTAARPADATNVLGPSGTARHPGHTCFGQTDNPHNSRHFPGDVSVSSRTVCPPHAVTVTVWLYKRVSGSWRLLDTGRNSGVGRTQANAHGRCGRRGTTHRFRGVARHTAVGHFPATTRNTKRVTCR
jgi:hypothetical protein